MSRMLFGLVVTLVVVSHGPVYARETFNIHALELGNEEQGIADLSLFSQANGQLPGLYLVAVYINGEHKAEEQKIRFVLDERGQLQPQLTRSLLKQWGVNKRVKSRRISFTQLFDVKL